MVKVSIIGSGNVAQHLIAAFLKSDHIELVQVYCRNPRDVAHILPFEKIIDDLVFLQESGLYIISVSDSAVKNISEKLPFHDRLVVHTSGSLALDAIDGKNRRGVFYPLQTFSKSRPLDFKTIPICIESERKSDFELIESAAKALSNEVYSIKTKQRQALHVAAVFANNFTNHMYSIAADICIENGMPFNILYPMIGETAQKIMSLDPRDAQTGPAARGDQNTVEAHLELLKKPNQKDLYKILTKSIANDAKL